MIKKYITSLLCSICILFSAITVYAIGGNELDIYSVAATLYGEAGCLDDTGKIMVAETIRNRYNFYNERKVADTISLRDIVIAPSQYLGFNNYRNKSVSEFRQFENSLSGQSRANWNRCMEIARQVASGTLNSNLAKGAAGFNQASVAYNKRTFRTETVFKDPGKYLGSGKASPHVFIGDFAMSPLKSPSGKTLASGGQIGSASVSGSVPDATKDTGHEYGELSASEDDKGIGRSCSVDVMREKYLGSDTVDTLCWYCKIVVVMTNAYMLAASKALPIAQALGQLILKLGFAIWLAYYILQQVSSIQPITPGKMLQEILVMGFKVALAYLAVTNAITVISEYFIDPIMGLGTDYGITLLQGILAG